MLNKENPVLLNKLVTASVGTPDYETYLGLFTMPENTTVEMLVESDGKVATFYTIFTDPHVIGLQLEREREKALRRYEGE